MSRENFGGVDGTSNSFIYASGFAELPIKFFQLHVTIIRYSNYPALTKSGRCKSQQLGLAGR